MFLACDGIGVRRVMEPVTAGHMVQLAILIIMI